MSKLMVIINSNYYFIYCLFLDYFAFKIQNINLTTRYTNVWKSSLERKLHEN